MDTSRLEDGLQVVSGDVDTDGLPDEDGRERPGDPDGTLEALRDEFVDAFNARDLDALLALVDRDVDLPDLDGDGARAFAEALEGIWERSPGALLTRAFLDEAPCAVAWLPDEDGCWSRAALVSLDHDDGLLSLVGLPDDADALDRAEAEDPSGDEIEEGSDWAEWDTGAETIPHARQ
jgi:hypothetical protein